MAKSLLPQLPEHGSVTRGWLGVQIQRVTLALAKTFKIEDVTGALVGQVFDNSPASMAKLERGDVIARFSGKPIKDYDDLPRIVASTPPARTRGRWRATRRRRGRCASRSRSCPPPRS